MRHLRTFFLAALVAACGHRYEVVHRAPQSPIGERGDVVLREPKAGDITVNGRSESDFVQSLSATERSAWNELLNVTRQAMMQGLMEHRRGLRLAKEGTAPEAVLELKAVDLARQDPRGPAKTTVRASLRIAGPNGQLADEVIFTSVIPAEAVTQDAIEATRERRLRRAGIDLGTQAAAYLRERAGIHD